MVGAQAYNVDLLARIELRCRELRASYQRSRQQLRVVGDHCEVMKRMNVFDPARDLQRAGKSQPHVAHCNRHRVAIYDHPPALCVGHDARAVIITIRDTRNRIGHAEVHEHERGRNRLRVSLTLDRESDGLGVRDIHARVERQLLTGPKAGDVVLAAARRPKPPAVVRNESLPLVAWIVERYEANRDLAALG